MELALKDIIFSDNLFFCTIMLNKYHYTDNRHGSPRNYLAYMETGHSKIVSEDITLEINEGDVFFIPTGLPYQSYWTSENEIIFKSYGFNYFPEMQTKNFILQKIDCTDGLKEQIKNIPTHTQTSNSLSGEFTDSFILGYFYSTLAKVLPTLKYDDLNQKKLLLEKAKKYIYNNTDCTVSDIAKHCLLSDSALYELFRKKGTTPNNQKQEIICEKAAVLLTTTDKSVQEISDMLGFSSTSYFRKILYRHTGKTPREIRKASLSV